MKRIIAFFSALTISALLTLTAFADELPPYSPESLIRDSNPLTIIICIAAAVAIAVTAICTIKYVKKKKMIDNDAKTEEEKKS